MHSVTTLLCSDQPFCSEFEGESSLATNVFLEENSLTARIFSEGGQCCPPRPAATPLMSVISDWWPETTTVEHSRMSHGRVFRCPATWSTVLRPRTARLVKG